MGKRDVGKPKACDFMFPKKGGILLILNSLRYIGVDQRAVVDTI